MAFQFKQNFNKGVNLDLDELRIPQDAAVFIKNMTSGVNANAGTTALSGANMGVRTPLEGNVNLSITLPSGNNFCIGFYSSEQTNEGYFFVYNAGGSHTIWVINGNSGATTLVYQDNLTGNELLPFTVFSPEYFISEGRVTLELRSYIDPVSGNESNYKFLIFTNNLLRQYSIEVTSSIATTSFSTTYFTASAAFYNPVEIIHAGVPTPLQCMSVTPVTPVVGDALLQNLLIRNGWQFRVKFIDVFGRESEHGIISSQYITIVGGGCITLSNGLPRCVNLQFDAGNPLVAYIQIEFRQWVGDDRAGALQTGWAIYDTISKYNASGATEWYNRSINPALTFTSGSNTITYTFCADKGNTPISADETSRTEPGLPRISNSVFSINKRIGLANNVRGFEPIDPAQIAKVTFDAIVPGTSSMCKAAPTCTIIVFAEIYGVFYNNPTIVRLRAGEPVFGNADDNNNNPYNYDQVFGGGQKGFTGYLVGLPEAVISQQVDFNKADGTYIIDSSGVASGGFNFSHCPLQMFTFTNVPIGEYIFRIASHKVTAGTSDLQQTSTYVAGIVNVSDLDTTEAAIFPTNPLKEIKINACSANQGDVVILNGFNSFYPDPTNTPILLIMDLTVPYPGVTVSLFGLPIAGTSAPAGIAMDGYLKEDNLDDNPIEMQAVNAYGRNTFDGYMDTWGSYYTDHNGFYFAVCKQDFHIIPQGFFSSEELIPQSTQLNIAIKIETCTGSDISLTPTSTNRGIKHGDGSVIPGTPAPTAAGVQGTWNNVTLAVPAGQTFPDCGRRYIEGNIDLCSSTIGIGGVPIVITKGALTYTDAGGDYQLIMHNRYDVLTYYSYIPYGMMFLSEVPGYSSSPANTDILIVVTRGACTLTACSGCVYCLGETVVAYIACVTPDCGIDMCGATSTCVHCRITIIGTIYASISGVNIQGVQSGGKYPVGFILHDEIGRHTFVQVAQGDAAFVNVPPLISYDAFALCSIGFAIDSSTVFPANFTKMTLVVAPNINFSDFFCWTCDYVQFVDITGQTNNVNPAQIRIYYGSNNEYQKQYNYSTNVGWQFITDPPPPAPPQPVEGDLIEFIMNGDGTWFTERIISQVTYDQAGAFITIDYIGDLAALKQFALFKVTRPIQNQPEYYSFYEQCLTIKLVAGVPQTLSGTLPYIDSYMLSRILPIPLAAGLSSLNGTTFQYTNNLDQSSVIDTTIATYAGLNNNKNGVIIMQLAGLTVDIFQSFPYYYESPSPSDTWGSHIASRGRLFTINPYEAQQRSSTEMALSDALGDRGVLNGLSYFEDKNIQTFDRNTWGQIIAVLVETSMCLVICDSDHFVVMYNQSILRQDDKGNILAQNQEGGIFTTPERKSGQNFGCIPTYINTIRKFGGIVYWLDAKGRLIRCDFGNSVDVSTYDPTKGVLGGYSGYLMNKIAELNTVVNEGETHLTYFVGGIDPRTKEYYLTNFNIPDDLNPSYINNLAGIVLGITEETMIVDLESGFLKGFASFTPEYYGIMPGYIDGKNFFSFKEARLWKHHAGVNTMPLYANFYGIQCPCMLISVVNPSAEKVKRFLWIEVYVRQNIPGATGSFSSVLFYAPAITTEKLQSSRLLIPRWDQRNGFQTTQFLNDLNTQPDPNLPNQTGANVILDGNPLQGRWLKILLQTNPVWAGTYFELSAIVAYVNGVEKSAD